MPFIIVTRLARSAVRTVAAVLALLAVCSGGAAYAGPPPTPAAEAQSVEQVEARWTKLTSEQRAAVIEQLIAGAQFETAERLIGRFEARTAAQKVTGRFLLGMLRNAQGRLDEAIEIYRDILSDKPELTRVRLQLGVALFQKQEDDSARHHFELVMGAAANTEVSNTVSRFIDQINQRKRLTFSTYASLVPSTNFNQGADAQYVTLNGLDFKVDPHSLRQSGIGYAAGFSTAYRAPITEGLDLVVGGGAHSKQFRNSAFDDSIALAEVGPRYRFSWGEIGAYATTSRRWFGGEQWWGGQPFASSAGGRLHGRVRLDDSTLLDTNVACVQKRYDIQVWQDGWNCAVSGTFDHFLDSRTFLRLLGGFDHESAARPWLDYNGGNVGLGVYREVAFGISLYSQAQYVRRVFGAEFPAAGVARVDNRLEATLQLTKRNWYVAGLAPMVQYTYTRNFSNVALFDYDAHSLNLTLTKSF